MLLGFNCMQQEKLISIILKYLVTRFAVGQLLLHGQDSPPVGGILRLLKGTMVMMGDPGQSPAHQMTLLGFQNSNP